MKILLLVLAVQSIQQLYNDAIADMNAERWSEAAAKFELVLKEDPAHIPTQFNLAVCHAKTGDNERAVELYRRILEQNADIYEARVNLAILLEETGNPSAAAEEFERAATLRPEDSEARFALGMFYMRSGEAGKAYAHLTAAEAHGLESSPLFIALSETAYQLNDEEQSLLYMEKAYALDSANKALGRQLGTMYARAGDLPKAIDAFNDALPESRRDLALAYFENRQYAEAAPLFAQLWEEDPSAVDDLYMAGQALMELRQYSQAADVFRRVIQVKPDHVEAYGVLGSVLSAQDDCPGAIETLTQYLEFMPEHASGYFLIAICFDKLEKSREALLHYNRFLELDDGSNDARSFQARQRARILSGRVRE